MVGNVPGFLPKTALFGSKLIYKPFLIPQKLTDSSYAVGKAGSDLVGGISGAMGKAYEDLKPRGPAKWLIPLFHKVNEAAADNDRIAMRNKAVFWDPFSQGSESIGRALAGPGAYWYLRKGGVEAPTADAIKGVLNTKLFKFPDATEFGGAPPAEPAPTPTPEPSPTPAPPAEPTPPAGTTPPAAAAKPGAATPPPGADAVVVASGEAASQAGEGAGSVTTTVTTPVA